MLYNLYTVIRVIKTLEIDKYSYKKQLKRKVIYYCL